MNANEWRVDVDEAEIPGARPGDARTGAARSAHSRAPLVALSRPELEGPAARVTELVQAILHHVRRRPLGAVAAAVGVGFLVGGALSFRIGRVALAVAARHLGRELLKQVL